MATAPEKSLINTVKVWLFPSVITVMSYMLYDDIKEIKADVKKLLTQSASDHTEIENLKQNITNLNNKVFVMTPVKDKSEIPIFPDGIKTPVALIHEDSNKYYIKKRNNV